MEIRACPFRNWQEYSCNAMEKKNLQKSDSSRHLKAVNVTEKINLHRNSSFDFKTGKYTSSLRSFKLLKDSVCTRK